MIVSYFNPFSSNFQQASIDYSSLSIPHRLVAIAAGIIGGILTPFIFCSGSFALFQLTVKWLKKGDNEKADKVSSLAEATIMPTEEEKVAATGKFILPDGDVCEVTFKKEDRIEPQDTDTFAIPNGGFVRGSFVNGLFKGFGKFILSNGYVYEGEFAEGEFTGQGKVTYPGGIVYEGNFIKWKPHGSGTATLKSGVLLKGTFTNDMKDGNGRLIFPNGSEIDVKLVDGQISQCLK